MKLLSMAVGGALGTLLRYGLSGVVYRFAGSTFPWGTLSVNLLGSLVIGILFALFEAAVVSNNLRASAMVGVLGGFRSTGAGVDCGDCAAVFARCGGGSAG
jgi:CrcB protein